MKDHAVIRIRVPDWATFAETVLRGILRYQREHWRPWRLVCEGELFGIQPEEAPASSDCDGAILFRPSAEEAADFRRHGVPLIALSTEGRRPGVPRVVADSVETGRRAARYFLRLGLRNCAFISDLTLSYARCWQRGFTAELAKAGAVCQIQHMSEDLLFPVEDRKQVGALLDDMLPGLPLPCGVFAKDRLAANILLAAERLDLRIPDDLSVLGAGYSEILALTCHPPLTTIDYPGERTGYEAAATLDRLMRKAGEVPRHVIVPGCELCERESTGAVEAFTGRIKQATRVIRERAPREPLTAAEMEDLCAGGSASSFRREFREQTGTTVKEMIKRLRLERLELLLLETRLTIKEITFEMKFSSTEELARFFRRAHQCSPTDFRQRSN
jgi:LacI family transcriptional regulator